MCSLESVYFSSSISRCTIMVSASAGMPAIPSSVDIAPSFISPPVASEASTGICSTTPLNAFTYSSAFSIRLACCTGFHPSVNATAPLLCISSISARSLPSAFCVAAPSGCRLLAWPFACCSTYCMIDLVLSTGCVFGASSTSVNPPVAAAFSPVSIVSLCSNPGSR